ncbi:MAG: hypothetical protein ACXVHJ_31965 [Solirubrobacteraceae bacterium]
MNATDAPLAVPAEVPTGPRGNGTADNGEEFRGARLFVSDVSVAPSVVTDAPLATPAEVQTGLREMAAADGHEPGGVRLFVSDVGDALSDVRLAFLLTDEAYERLVAQVFGIPREKQTFLVKLILTGALVTVLEGLAPRPPRIRPSGADAAMGAAVLNTALRGIVGAPSRSMPAAGALIGFALLAHSLRSAMTRSSHDLHALTHKAEARYGHHSAMSVATDRTARS